MSCARGCAAATPSPRAQSARVRGIVAAAAAPVVPTQTATRRSSARPCTAWSSVGNCRRPPRLRRSAAATRRRSPSCARARPCSTSARAAGVTNVHFLKGVIEQVPLPAKSVDVVISNCVINLSVDKPAVLAEIGRVLKPGGRLGISDVVAEDRLSPEERAERGSYVGCIAGALSRTEYEQGLAAAGFEQVSVAFTHQTHQLADGLHS